MLTPTFEYLKSISLNSGMPKSYAFGSRMHRNPRLYKYLWRIFWEGSQRRRLGIAIWDYSSPKILRDGEFAPSYDDDPDPLTGDAHK